MQPEAQQPRGSGTRWGPLFGARAREWADTWEGPSGWGTPVYEHVLTRASVRAGTRILDCGCGAGRFARMAADRGATVAGIDASRELISIALERLPDGDFRVGDFETLPWPDNAFDLVTGFSAFQFADNKKRALVEARRVASDIVTAVVPTRVPESGLSTVFKQLLPLFPPSAVASMKDSGMFALSEPGKLDELLAAAGLTVHEDDEMDCPIRFSDLETAELAFIGAGPVQMAIEHLGEDAIRRAVRNAIGPLVDAQGGITLAAWYRVVIARPE